MSKPLMSTQKNLSSEPWVQAAPLQSMMRHFRENGYRLRFVGGCVRDALLGLPVHDIDMATDAPPDISTALLESQGVRVIPTGIAFGTVTAQFEDWQAEITTLRADHACDGRHAEVRFGTSWEEDAQRRDFTINALYCDASGDVLDYVGGLKDLQAHRVRFIGNAAERIEEDALRMLRFFRFWSRYAKAPMDPETLDVIAASQPRLARLSGERIGQEMRALMETPRMPEALHSMQEAGLTEELFGSPICLEPLSWLQLIAMEVGMAVEWATATALALPERKTAKAQAVEPLFKRWRLSRAEQKHLTTLVTRPTIHGLAFIEAKAHLRQIGRERFAQQVLMEWALEATRHMALLTPHTAAYRSMLALAFSWDAPAFPLRGEDLIELGYPADESLGMLLRRLEQLWEHSDFMLTRQQMLQYALEQKAVGKL